jgi:hypothetical protein
LVGAALTSQLARHGGRLRTHDLAEQLIYGNGCDGDQGHHDDVFRQKI